MVKTRFAPSPTGELHIGGARTALFSYLFAKSQKGEFLLRIEDTDRERFVEGATERIIESLKWLGIEPDNKTPYVQSEHLEQYKETALKLLIEDKAYICNCSKERLKELKEEQIKKGLPPIYDGKCRNSKIQETITSQILNSKFQIPEGSVVRMKMPEKGKIIVKDLIRGEVEFDAALLDDQIILKSDGYPTYHLASVVDDHEMEITHVIRAEEWLSSTPKHLVLYEMLGWKTPVFAHLSMILGPDKKKLSKRHGATSVIEYKNEGYLSEALVNFIAFLGWNPKDEREIFSMEELIKEFKLENVNKAAAIFDLNKLNHTNSIYLQNQISNIKYQNDKEKIKNYLEQYGVKDFSDGEAELLSRGGYITLKEAAEYIKKLRKESEYDQALLIFKKSTKPQTLKGLEETRNKLQETGEKDWNIQELQIQMGLIVERNNLANGDVFWPVRVALSGEEKSPSPAELAVALGKEESLNRLMKAIKKLK